MRRRGLRPDGGQGLLNVLPVLIMVGTVLFGVTVASLSAGTGWPRVLLDLRPYAWPATVAVGLGLVLLSIAQWRLAGRDTGTPTPRKLARARELLADQVLNQVLDDIGLWRLDQAPIAVTWDWQASGEQQRPARWTSGGYASAGPSMAVLADWYAELPHKRLALLGDGGMGKTSLALQLARYLLSHDPAGPVPVPLSVASWNPGREPLDDWLARRLGEDYPALRAPEFGPDAPAMLVRRRRILPLLDGVDELPADLRAAAFAELGRLATSSDPLILTCRSQAWIAVGAAPAWVDATLTAEPLPASVAAGYVAELSRGDLRWQPVLGALTSGEDGRLARALDSPLALWLLRVGYLDSGANPLPLFDTAAFPDAGSLREHLLDRLVPELVATRRARDETDPGTFRMRRAWHPEDARRWLEFLAVHLTEQGTTDLRWWRLHKAWPLTRNGVVARSWAAVVMAVQLALGCLLVLAVVGDLHRAEHDAGIQRIVLGFVAVGTLLGLALGNFLYEGGIQSVLRIERADPAVASLRVFVRSGRFGRMLAIGLAAGAAAGAACAVLVNGIVSAAASQGFAPNPPPPTWSSVIGFPVAHAAFSGLAAGAIIGGVVTVLRTAGAAAPLDAAGTAVALLRSDRRLALLACAGFMLAVGLVYGPAAAPAGLVFEAGRVVAVGEAWVTYQVARTALAASRQVPWRLMTFLGDMRQIGVLRSSGIAYQFRHVDLQRQLAVNAGPAALKATARQVETYRTMPEAMADAVTRTRQRHPWMRQGVAPSFKPELAAALTAFARVRGTARQDLDSALAAAREAVAIYQDLNAQLDDTYGTELRDAWATVEFVLARGGLDAQAAVPNADGATAAEGA